MNNAHSITYVGIAAGTLVQTHIQHVPDNYQTYQDAMHDTPCWWQNVSCYACLCWLSCDVLASMSRLVCHVTCWLSCHVLASMFCIVCVTLAPMAISL